MKILLLSFVTTIIIFVVGAFLGNFAFYMLKKIFNTLQSK